MLRHPGTRAVVVFAGGNVCTRRAGCPMQETVADEAFYVTGALNITSNMTFRIEKGATVLGVPQATLYHWPLVVQCV